jgi:outer membrane receptor protein involved in Fe transport
MGPLKSENHFFRYTALAAAVAATVVDPRPTFAQQLEEVLVTATRRETSTLDVPYNISVYSGDLLQKRDILNLGEFVRQVPGLNFNDVGLREAGNNNTLVMRGLSADAQMGASEIPSLARPTVSTYIGETPVYYNLRLTDINRVEVLRGPQGTIYGSGSLGGTLRILPNKPDPEAFQTRIRGGTSSTEDAGDLNYDADVMVNVPLADNAALRVSAGYGHVAGFVDAVDIGLRDEDGAFVLEDPDDFVGSGPDRSGKKDDSNKGHIKHLRPSLLWNVTDSIEALLTYHYEESETDNYQAQSFGEDRTLSLAGLNPFDADLNLASLEVTADLGFATLTSATSGYKRKTKSRVDASGIYEDFFSYFYFYYPRISTLSDYEASDKSFVQEFRFTSNGDGPLSWIGGVFYLHQDLQFDTVQTMPGFNSWWEAAGFADYYGTPTPLTDPPDLVYDQDRSTTYEEMAVFGDITYALTEAWDITAGARVFEQKINAKDSYILPTCYVINDAFGAGFYCGEPPLGGASTRNNDTVNDQIYKLNTSYSINEDTNAYLTWSQGFRNGGVNAFPTVGFVDDTLGGEYPNINVYRPDKVDNYEVGVKGLLADRSLRYSAAVYYIEWHDPQARITGAATGVDGVSNSNADAHSWGTELEINGILGEHWNYSLAYAYTNAEFVEDGAIYNTPISDGTKLPGHSENMVAAALGYNTELAGHPFTIETDVSYRSDFENGLPGSPSEYNVDSYTIWNANVSYEVENWTVRLYGKNLADENAVMSASLVSPQTDRQVISRPRTIGFSVTYQIN